MALDQLQLLTASITKSESYPENLCNKPTYPDALKTYRQRLEEIEDELCSITDEEVIVPFRDLLGNGPDFERHKVYDDETLQTHLAPLKINKKMLFRILTYYQVTPYFLELLHLFGSHQHSLEKGFSSFRADYGKDKAGLELDALGRSGDLLQMCYNLKAIAKYQEQGNPASWAGTWTVSQAAVLHQFDIKNGKSVWLVARASLDIKQRIESMTGRMGRNEDRQFQTPKQCLRSAFAVHILLCYWSSENWRAYIQWLENIVNRETFGVTYGPRSRNLVQISLPSHLQGAQNREELTAEAIVLMKGNCSVMQQLKDFYQRLLEDTNSALQMSSSTEIVSFAAQLDNFIYDSHMLIDRAKFLSETIAARKNVVGGRDLVSVWSHICAYRKQILHHLQSQATERMEDLTESMRKDSLTVRIIAFITFVYLPATFVSTFFSTDVVKYQDGSNSNSVNVQSSSFSSLALKRWLEVALPLTLLTFVAAIVWQWHSSRKLKKVSEKRIHMTEVRDV